jgi:D-glycerate 3-kinase
MLAKLFTVANHIDLKSLIAAENAKQRLPDDFAETVDKFYVPLATAIAEQAENSISQNSTPLFLGIYGSQGSVKSTLADFLKLLLEHQHNTPSVVMSLDDFYLTRAERQRLSTEVHPLLKTRGVPGTHDIPLLEQTLKGLLSLREGESLSVPLFNKAKDDRAPFSDWQSISRPPKVVILEGWCVGVMPQSEDTLYLPINELESTQDKDGVWRHFVNQQLREIYSPIFAQFNTLIALVAPGFECVHEWRLLQESKLIASLVAANESTAITMSADEIDQFIAHYQRLTEHALATLPDYADWCLHIDKSHNITSVTPDFLSRTTP